MIKIPPRSLPMVSLAAKKRSGFGKIVTNDTNGKHADFTIGRTPNVPDYFGSRHSSRLLHCACVGFEKFNNTSGQLHANIYIQAFVDVIILAAISQYYNYTVVVCSQMCSYVVSMKPYQVLKTISQFIVSFSTNLTAEKKGLVKNIK